MSGSEPPGETPTRVLEDKDETELPLGQASPDADTLGQPADSLSSAQAYLGQPEPHSDAVSGRYELSEVLGRGGMGEVWSAEDLRMRRHVALKRIRTGGDRDGASARFLREAQLTGRLEHPNIVPVYDLAIAGDGSMYFTMKRVEGRSLEELIEQGNAGSRLERLDIFRKVCDAIAFAHSGRVVHRDLKPANVMIGRYGEVTVLDWGLAKPLTDEAEPQPEHSALPGTATRGSGGDGPSISESAAPGSSLSTENDSNVALTQGGDIMGTPAFMAPEQAEGRHTDVDERTDVFALGVMLYVLLTDERPFRGQLAAIIMAIAEGRFEPPRARKPSVPVELEAIVLTAMAHAPSDRYDDVQALRNDVQAFLEGRPVSVLSYGPVRRARKWAARHQGIVRSVAGTGALALAGLATATGLYLRHLQSARDAAQDARVIAEDSRDQATSSRDRAVNAEREAQRRWVHSELSLATAFAEKGDFRDARTHLDSIAPEVSDLGGIVDLRYQTVASQVVGAQAFPVAHLEGTPLATSPDGQLVALQREDEAVLYDWVRGRVLGTLRVPDGRAHTASIRNGKLRVAVRGGEDEPDVLLEAPSGRTVMTGEPGQSFRLAAGGEYVVVLTADGYARVLTVADETPLGPPCFLGAYRGVSDDGKYLLGDPTNPDRGFSGAGLTVFETRTARKLSTLVPSSTRRMTPDNEIVLITRGRRLQAFERETGRELWSVQTEGQSGQPTVTPDGNTIAMITASNTLVSYDREGKEVQKTTATGSLYFLSNDGLAMTHEAGRVEVRMNADAPHAPWQVEHPLEDVTPLATGEVFASVSREHPGIQIWDTSLAEVVHEIEMPAGQRSLQLSGDGTSALIVGEDAQVRLVDLVSGRIASEFGVPTGAHSARFADGEQTVIVSHLRGDLELYDLESGHRIMNYDNPNGMIWALEPSPSGTRVAASLRHDQQARAAVWAVDDPTPLWTSADAGPAYGLDWSPDERFLAIGTQTPYTALVWESLGSSSIELPDHRFAVLDVAFSPDSVLFATGDLSGKVRLFSTDGWEEIHELALFDSPVQNVEFLANRKLLVSGRQSVILFDIGLDGAVQSLRPDTEVGAENRSQDIITLLGMTRGWPTIAGLLEGSGWNADDAWPATVELHRAAYVSSHPVLREAALSRRIESIDEALWRTTLQGRASANERD